MNIDISNDWLQKEYEIEAFRYKCNAARISNREACRKHRIEFSIMTPEEEWYQKLFNHETVLVQDMDRITLRAHIEELQQICKEGRVRFYVAKSAEEKREKDGKARGITGFVRPSEGEIDTSDAINTIKKRQARLSKSDKLIEGLMKLPGIDRVAAEKIMSARNIKDVVENSPLKSDGFRHEDLKKQSVPESPIVSDDNNLNNGNEPKKSFNPFEK